MFEKSGRIKRYIVESLVFSFGVHFGWFFSYVFQQVVEIYKSSLVITEHSYKFGIGEEFIFTEMISKCSNLSDTVIVLSTLGVMSLFVFLLIILHYVDKLSQNDRIEILILIISLISWILAPPIIIYNSTRNPLLYFGLDIKNATVPASELAILSEHYRYLHQFWFFGNTFVYEMKILFTIVATLASSAILKLKKLSWKNISLEKLIIFVPILLYVLLEFLLPRTYELFASEQVTLEIAGIGCIEIGPTEFFVILGSAMIFISWILLFIQAYLTNKKESRF